MTCRSAKLAGLATMVILASECISSPHVVGQNRESASSWTTIETVESLWDGCDPRALPLETEVVRAWDEGEVHLEAVYFTGEVFEGAKTRVFGYLGRPKRMAGKVPGILHIHGGGQTANLDWPRFWARRGYVCLSFDFCGNTNLPTLGPEYRRERYTLWGKVPADMMKVGGGTQMEPSPRYNPWFHWTMAARRGLTLLEQQPDVDSEKLGIFGISVGGTLSWIVAGVDRRVKAAAPIYGCGWESYPFPPQPEAAPDRNKRLWRALICPEAHAPRITCPVLLLSATNDGHGKMDLAFRTLDLLRSPPRSQVFSVNYDHHVEPAEAKSLPLWMDVHLKGRGGPWPKTPVLAITGPGVPEIHLRPDQADRVKRVDLYYCLNNDWPMSRFWRTVPEVRRVRDAFVGRAPFQSAGDVLFVFGNVTYETGIRISSRLLRKPAAEIEGARSTLARQRLIDAMDTAVDWNWVPAYTDPNQEDATFFSAWNGGDGQRGFTLDRKMFDHRGKMHYYFGTRKIGDPQFRGEDRQVLLIDCLAEHLPESLKVRLLWRTPATYGDYYEAEAGFARNDSAARTTGGTWIPLRFERAQLVDKDGKSLPDWKHVEQFILIGANPPGKPPVFKRLRWGT